MRCVAMQNKGERDLLIGKVRAFADLSVNCSGEVAQLHVPGGTVQCMSEGGAVSEHER